MNNNDILIRLRYALEIRNSDLVEIFKLGGIEVTQEEVMKMLIKSKNSDHDDIDNNDDIEENDEKIKCTYFMIDSFLNGFIIFKRGQQGSKTGQHESPAPSMKSSESVNNLMLKKLKIALSLTSDDILDILNEAGIIISKGELSAVLRKEGHRNYKECGDKYARNFLKGLAIKYRE
ncbi:MAG: DUF1456 domain-containing protein [Firmicutes bacterium HGW-Firmicutes-1]|nr:MAG: DUF1456 domain-containing protein [Firmicutes bacterium HGW-Firmicutes-1]